MISILGDFLSYLTLHSESIRLRYHLNHHRIKFSDFANHIFVNRMSHILKRRISKKDNAPLTSLRRSNDSVDRYFFQNHGHLLRIIKNAPIHRDIVYHSIFRRFFLMFFFFKVSVNAFITFM